MTDELKYPQIMEPGVYDLPTRYPPVFFRPESPGPT